MVRKKTKKRLKALVPTALSDNMTALIIVAIVVGGGVAAMAFQPDFLFDRPDWAYDDADTDTTTTTTTIFAPPPEPDQFIIVASFEWDPVKSDFHVGLPEDILVGVYLNEVELDNIYLNMEMTTYMSDSSYVFTEGAIVVLKMEGDYGGSWMFLTLSPQVHIEPNFVVGTDGYVDFYEPAEQWNFALMHIQWIPV